MFFIAGWEHVFSGELKSNEVDGQHDWVRYYTEQKADKMVYDGYYTHDDVFSNFQKSISWIKFQNLIGTFQYQWQGATKPKGGFFTGTSPGNQQTVQLKSLHNYFFSVWLLDPDCLCSCPWKWRKLSFHRHKFPDHCDLVSSGMRRWFRHLLGYRLSRRITWLRDCYIPFFWPFLLDTNFQTNEFLWRKDSFIWNFEKKNKYEKKRQK